MESVTYVGSPIIEFPNRPFEVAVDDIVAVGGELNSKNLIEAYRRGIFPWPQPHYPMLWYFPAKRGILEFSDFHIPKSLMKFLKKKSNFYRLSVNENFPDVIENCRTQIRPNQNGTWILSELKKAYMRLHEEGVAHSVEVWSGSSLVGGIYGVLVNGVFSGESMFYKEANVSKLAFIHLVKWLQSNGMLWMDIQMVTPITESFGGKYISGKDYFYKLPFSKGRS